MTTPVPTRVLLVDDEPDIREMMAQVLSHEGFEVVTATTGREGIDAMRRHAFDVVVADVRMPDGGGNAVLDWARARDAANPRMVFISGFSDVSPEDAYDRGVDAMLVKPFDLETLLEATRTVLAPGDAKWSQPSSDADIVRIERAYESLEHAERSGLLGLGRGGLFLAVESDLPHCYEQVRFSITCDRGRVLRLAGDGVVRWVRHAAEESYAAGIGVEFSFLEPASRVALGAFLEQAPRVALIPLGKRGS